MTNPSRQTLAHEAMATTFQVTVVHGEPAYARQAVAAALAELDQLDGRLSRFVEGSDVFRINRLDPGESTRVHLDTLECLRIALAVQRETHGAFDVAYGSRTPQAAGPRFEVDERGHAVRVLTPGMRLDLGGIAKGFALDRMAAVLNEWEVDQALLAASTSTLLALAAAPGEAGWPIRIGPEHDSRQQTIAHRAVSGSGPGVRGSHIRDPRTGQPASGCRRAWTLAPSGAVADALSTALVVMSEADARQYAHCHPEIDAYLQRSADSPLVTLGNPHR